MKLRKLLRKVREQSCVYYIKEIEQATYDGKQWRVRGHMLLGLGHPLDWNEGRFNSFAECDEYIKAKYWERIQHNIANLRKKYNRPSKRMKYDRRYTGPASDCQ